MNPQEAVQVFQDTRTKQAIAMHWGTFTLTDEPLGEPLLCLENALRNAGIDGESFTAGAVGQCWCVEWWHCKNYGFANFKYSVA